MLLIDSTMSFAHEDEGESVKRALTTSSQQSSTNAPPGLTNSGAVDLTSDTDDEDEDLRRAIALSLQQSEQVVGTDSRAGKGSFPTKYTTTSDESKDPIQPRADILQPKESVTPAGRTGILGLDRKIMEQERLARLGKRKRDTSPEQPSKRSERMPSPTTPPTIRNTHDSSKLVELQYPRGVIKRTFATKYPRTDDITVDELLQASSVNIAVISSFMWDAEWLYKKLDPTKVKQIWIMNAKEEDVQQRWVREMKETGVPNLKVHFPPMDGMTSSMHSKFMLLFGKDKLRFVVPTANMTRIDWGEVANDWQPGVMENTVFLVDLPRRADAEVGRKAELTSFGQELVYFLEQQQVAKKVIEGVQKFDFSQTGHLAFVHSM